MRGVWQGLVATALLAAALPLHGWDDRSGAIIAPAVAPARARPNLVLFLADDLGWGDGEVYGPASGIRTPRMAALAREGTTFTHAFVDSPSCAPSRAALLTGLYPARNGAMFNHTVPEARHRRWPDYFRELGYETVAFGKVAHYATVQQYGFDHASHFRYHQDDCVTAAVEWLERRKSDRPLCLIVGTNWPHVPWPAPAAPHGAVPLAPKMVDTPETREYRARYATAVAYADRDLGLVRDAVRRRLGPDTLFVFSSDHGSQFPFGKWNCYDAGIRTPLIAAWAGKIAAGERSDAMVSWVDLLPTFLEAAGSDPPESGDVEGRLSGRSFLPVLLGRRRDHRDVIYATHSGDGRMNEYPIRACREREWKYLRNLRPSEEHHTHVDRAQPRDGSGYWESWVRRAVEDPAARELVSRYHRRPAEELYDLRSDPHEEKNLATDPAGAAVLAGLRARLDAWMAAQGDRGLPTEEQRRPPARG